jgi:hypothetical protein
LHESANRVSCVSAKPRTEPREFYRERTQITKRLIPEKGFNAIVIEGDFSRVRPVFAFRAARGVEPLERVADWETRPKPSIWE